MIEKIFARQLPNGLWQWRLRGNKQWQHEGYYTGDNEALSTSLEGVSEAPVCLILPGENCVSRLEAAETSNKRTLAKLLPYEMEDDIVDSIDQLHFSLGNIVEQKIPVVYTQAETLKNAIDNLLEVDCDVQDCLPDYLLLHRDEDEFLLVWDEDKVLACYGNSQGFAVEAEIAQLFLQQMKLEQDAIGKITLVAENNEKCEELVSWLPDELRESELEIFIREGGFWDCIDTESVSLEINFRSGKFARQLPYARWWNSWKKPTYYAAAAVLTAIVVNFAMYFEAKGEYERILQTRKEVFLQAVPNGRWQSPERELKSRLGNKKGSNEPTDFLYLLDGVAKVLETKKDISLSSFRYSGEQHELIIGFEVANAADVENVRKEIQSNGLVAEILRTAAQGEVFQARMKISGAAS